MRFICAGLKMTSSEWLAMAGLLFGVEATVNGEKTYLRDLNIPLRYGCPHCKKAFTSHTTPEICPHCKEPPGEQGVSVTHKTYTGVTFPFAG